MAISNPKTTACQGVGCGKAINYKVRKPRFCKSCKVSQIPSQGSSRRRSGIPKTSKKELLVARLSMAIFSEIEVIHNGYYSWIRSPKGQPMQLDVYIPQLKVAIEVDGKQHTTYSTYMHGKGKAGLARFEYLQACDKLKDDLCSRAGIDLLRIRHDRTITPGYLLRRLENEGILERARAAKVTVVTEAG